MTESERIAIIKNAVENATRIVPQQFKGLVEELKNQQATEDFITENGLLPVSEDEVEEEYTVPTDEDSTELGEVPEEPKKGSITPYYVRNYLGG